MRAGSPCATRAREPQRPLWASTGTKDPAYSDVLYVEELIAPGRHQHDARGHAARLRRPRRRARAFDPARAPAEETLRRAEDAGVDLAAITAELEREGVRSFCDSYRDLLACIEAARPDVDHDAQHEHALDDRDPPGARHLRADVL